MKSYIKYFVVALIMGMNVSAGARSYVISVQKRGGIFNLFNYVQQSFVGVDQWGNGVYRLVCHDPGWTRCKLNSSSLRKAGDSGLDNEITDHAEDKFDDVSYWVDNKIENENEDSGTENFHYSVQLSDNSWVDIYIEVTWEPDSQSSGDYLITCNINIPALD